MARASEEITKGLTSDIIRDIIDYPSNQNIITHTTNAQKKDVHYSNSNNVESTDKRDMSATFGQILLSILLPIVGLIYGFVIKKDGRNKAGNTCIIISIIVMVLLWIFA